MFWSFGVVNVDDVDGSSFSSFSRKAVEPTHRKSTGSDVASSRLVLLDVSVEWITLGPVLGSIPSGLRAVFSSTRMRGSVSYTRADVSFSFDYGLAELLTKLRGARAHFGTFEGRVQSVIALGKFSYKVALLWFKWQPSVEQRAVSGLTRLVWTLLSSGLVLAVSPSFSGEPFGEFTNFFNGVGRTLSNSFARELHEHADL